MKSEATLTQVATSALRWMVVDDTDAIRELVALLLQRLGRAEIYSFRSGAEALAAFTAAPDSYQFVVTDFEMPGMDGLELRQRLHAIAPGLKIILATGSSRIAPEAARAGGFCGLLNKPFPLPALRSALADAGVLNFQEASPAVHDPVCVAA